MKNRTVKVNGAPPSKTPKAVTYADIKGQGRIPYGKTAPAPVAGGLTDFANTPRKMRTRGTVPRSKARATWVTKPFDGVF